MSEEQSTLKSRLVGAMVLIAIAVIVVPWLLDGAGVEHAFQPQIEMPARPKPPPSQLTPRQLAPRPSPAAPSPPTPAAEPAALPTPPEAPADPVFPLQSWVVQVASVASEPNAKALAEQLRAAGFPAFVQLHEQDGSSRYRVRIGPVVRREQAQAVLERLAATQGHKGVIYSYP